MLRQQDRMSWHLRTLVEPENGHPFLDQLLFYKMFVKQYISEL